MASDAKAPEILHGGAERLPLRWRREGDGQPDKLSWYRVAAGDRCSLHRHTGKAETWLIVAGEGRAEIGTESYAVTAGDAFQTEAGTAHALTNLGVAPLIFVNIVRLTGGPVTTTELDAP